MAEVKLSKTELRNQQQRLSQLQKYLPTLQLKKALLQHEVSEAKAQIRELEKKYRETKKRAEAFSELLSEQISFSWEEAIKIDTLDKRFENIAGVEVPYLEKVTFLPFEYSFFDTPPWVDPAFRFLKMLKQEELTIVLAEEKKRLLEAELREVSIRVNLFEKILIPRSLANIKKIKVFLGDQQLAAVSQAKVAKEKILQREGEYGSV